jgi:Tol biopolymer transport system component
MSDPITRLNAALEGRYEIERELGEGGMATVYLARDERHNRNVALKVLKPELAAVVGAERFLAEIETTANLQHPHILPLFDSGEADSFLFYVMPYIEGESLRERLEREKQLPVEEAVRIASDVAEALQVAHERGVIHRDIKPANILLSGGRPLVADFGIALAVGSAGDRLTETGLSVGTPYYMSPEQATGDQPVGAASDTYALGCVLYEMLVGEPPHVGNSAQAVLTKILQGDLVAPTAQRATVPRHIDAAVRKALERLPADRFASASAFSQALGDRSFRHGPSESISATPRWGGWRATAAAGWIAALFLLALLTVGSADRVPTPALRSQVPMASGQEWGWAGGINLALSRDGSTLVYAGSRHLWRRRLGGLETVPISGTEWGRNPVISPDGSTLAFVARGSLRTVSMQGGPATVVVGSAVRDARGGFSWSTNELLYFVDLSGAIRRIPIPGGESVVLAEPGPGQIYGWIDALPDDRGVVFTIIEGATDLSRIAVLDLETGAVRTLLPGTTARYVRTGHLVYATADGMLSSVPFDLDRLETTGASTQLIDRVDVQPGSASQFAVSDDGLLAYTVDSAPKTYRVVQRDREGNAVEIDPGWEVVSTADYGSMTLSPAGDRLAVSQLMEGAIHVWVKPLGAEPRRAITFEASTINHKPAWSHDGSLVAFISDREGQYDVWVTRPDGAGSPVRSLDRPSTIDAVTYSRDGRWIVYGALDGGNVDIYAAPLDREGDDVTIADTGFEEVGAAVSPDSRWLAYASDQSGRFEVYVVSFPNPLATERVVVSTGGGHEPVWGLNGREIFYRSEDHRIVAVRYEADDSFRVVEREDLFTAEGYPEGPGQAQFAVSPDGQSLYMFQAVPPRSVGRIMLVQNLFAELRERS